MRRASVTTHNKLSNNFTLVQRETRCLGCKGSLVRIQSRRPLFHSHYEPLSAVVHRGSLFLKSNLNQFGSGRFNEVRAPEVRGRIDHVFLNLSANSHKTLRRSNLKDLSVANVSALILATHQRRFSYSNSKCLRSGQSHQPRTAAFIFPIRNNYSELIKFSQFFPVRESVNNNQNQEENNGRQDRNNARGSS